LRENLCLVTGACGFNGSYMVELLLEKGYKVRATDLEGTERGIYEDLVKREGVEFVPSDLTKKETLKEVVKDVEYVFHPAAVFDYAAKWELMERVNVFGTRNLCEVLMEEGKVKKFVVWSSAAVYGIPKPELLPVKEDALKNPSNRYERVKWQQEEVVREFHQKHKLAVIIIRPVPIYGPRNVYGVAQLIFNFSKLRALAIPKNMKQGIPFIHVKDVCNAALFLSQKEEAVGQAYNIGDESNFTLYDFVHLLGEVEGKKVYDLPKIHLGIMKAIVKGVDFLLKIISKIIPLKVLVYFAETTLYAVSDFKFSNEKLKATGYQFLYPTVRDGMKETIEWYRSKKMMK